MCHCRASTWWVRSASEVDCSIRGSSSCPISAKPNPSARLAGPASGEPLLWALTGLRLKRVGRCPARACAKMYEVTNFQAMMECSGHWATRRTNTCRSKCYDFSNFSALTRDNIRRAVCQSQQNGR